jgi:hypothetical protein
MAEQQLSLFVPVEQEIWRPAPDFEGWYSVSNLGRIRREVPYRNTNVGGVRHVGVSSGYNRLTLTIKNRRVQVCIHRLVAAAFIGPCPPGLCVNHIDGDKRNNRPANLEYVTIGRNSEHAWETGLIHAARGERHGFAKLCESQAQEVLDLADRRTAGEWAARLEVSRSAIMDIVKRKTWKHLSRNRD